MKNTSIPSRSKSKTALEIPASQHCKIYYVYCIPIAEGAVGPLVEEDGDNVRVPVEYGQLQRRPALVTHVDIDPVLEQAADSVRLTVPKQSCSCYYR